MVKQDSLEERLKERYEEVIKIDGTVNEIKQDPYNPNIPFAIHSLIEEIFEVSMPELVVNPNPYKIGKGIEELTKYSEEKKKEIGKEVEANFEQLLNKIDEEKLKETYMRLYVNTDKEFRELREIYEKKDFKKFVDNTKNEIVRNIREYILLTSPQDLEYGIRREIETKQKEIEEKIREYDKKALIAEIKDMVKELDEKEREGVYFELGAMALGYIE